MIPSDVKQSIVEKIETAAHPKELVVDVMMAYQENLGFLTDEAVIEVAGLLGMTPLQIDELATFYTFIYREPVGKYVIHVCDSVICWMDGYIPIIEYLMEKLKIRVGETTEDGLFTLLPVCCIGYCDRAPAMMINKKVYGFLTPEKIDGILDDLTKKKAE
jgi:NADH-quinone oxidoreductase subunit E